MSVHFEPEREREKRIAISEIGIGYDATLRALSTVASDLFIVLEPNLKQWRLILIRSSNARCEKKRFYRNDSKKNKIKTKT